ncbi:plant UBX domain-containing protein 2-like [Macadamia integrifolia]|uniref:plant UBX domain-containing protein 2-like n=1 Tax=Macadamia integrifolia TaxID=60698 RepID=UPI001C4E80D3|nr:plant UBX domain-containing protein 2-like [Macadamia integrifolia]
MDDVKDKVKGFMKKVNNPFSSSSSGKFKGQGRVLGSSSSSSSGPSKSNLARPTQIVDSRQNPPVSNPKPKPQIPQTNSDSNQRLKNEPIPQKQNALNSDHKEVDGFDPFGSLVTSGKRSQNGYSLNVFECPVCNTSFRSEEDVSLHIESCVIDKVENADVVEESQANVSNAGARNELMGCVGVFLSGSPLEGSVEVVLKLLRNIIKEPNNAKFRRIRMSNPKIREAVGVVAGGVELLECVGFRLQEEDGEMWAVMEEPSEEQISLIKGSTLLLEPRKTEDVPCFSRKVEELPSVASTEVEVPVESKKIDRQIRVFFSVPESIARQIDLPESFYNLSAEELRREAEMRKKKIAESQLLIPKSYKEKQAKAVRKRYKNAVIRIQFPDEVVLQGVFFPWEPTTVLYEFVSSALKEPSMEFELLHPVMIKRRVIPRFPVGGDRTPTLEEEDLVPMALVKFKPIETDSVVFTGLCNEFLEISEPLRVDG